MADKKTKLTLFDKAGYALDSAIGLISPAAGYKRTVMRDGFVAIKGMSGQYRGAKTNRLNEKYTVLPGSADQDTIDDLPKLRQRSRDLIRNNPFAGSIAHTIDTNIVGMGIRPQCRIKKDRVVKELGISIGQASEIAEQMEEIWERWVPFASADNRLNFYQMQALVNRQRFENGDVFLIPVMKPIKNDRPYELAFQTIEADRVDTPRDKLSEKNFRAGVEIDDFGAPIAYHISEGFPGDWRYHSYAQNTQFRSIPAYDRFGRKNVMHIYKMLRPDQSRGVPDLANVIETFNHLDQYLEAEIISARVAACLSLFIKTVPDALNNGLGFAGTGAETNTRGQIIDDIEPGMVKYLFQGEDIVTWNPARPGQTFDAFVQVILRMIAAGQNLSYEMVAKDYTKSNYSNTKASLQMAYKGFRNLQSFIAWNLCQPAWNMLMEEAYLRGHLQLPNFYEKKHLWMRVQWMPDGWEWVDPKKETEANVMAVENNIKTLADIAAERGMDEEDIIDQRGKELKLIKDAEEKYGVKFSKSGAPKAVAEKSENENENEKTGPEETEE